MVNKWVEDIPKRLPLEYGPAIAWAYSYIPCCIIRVFRCMVLPMPVVGMYTLWATSAFLRIDAFPANAQIHSPCLFP